MSRKLCCERLTSEVENDESPIQRNEQLTCSIATRFRGFDADATLFFCPFCGADIFPDDDLDGLICDELERDLSSIKTRAELFEKLGQPDGRIEQNDPRVVQFTFRKYWPEIEVTVREDKNGKLRFSYGKLSHA